MKKNILLILVFAISFYTNAQNNISRHGITTASINRNNRMIIKNDCLKADSTPVKTRQHYLDVSKQRRNTGFGFLGVGTAFIITGLIIGGRNNSTWDEMTIGGVAVVSGVLFALGSIPFFISSKVNKQRALLAISIQPRSSIASLHPAKSIPGLSLKIPIH
jgi:hypothetical protein